MEERFTPTSLWGPVDLLSIFYSFLVFPACNTSSIIERLVVVCVFCVFNSFIFVIFLLFFLEFFSSYYFLLSLCSFLVTPSTCLLISHPSIYSFARSVCIFSFRSQFVFLISLLSPHRLFTTSLFYHPSPLSPSPPPPLHSSPYLAWSSPLFVFLLFFTLLLLLLFSFPSLPLPSSVSLNFSPNWLSSFLLPFPPSPFNISLLSSPLKKHQWI